MSDLDDQFLWFDLETTGLSPHHDRILEVGAVLSDTSCSLHSSGFSQVVRFTSSQIDTSSIHPDVLEMHNKSGLFRDTATSWFTIADVTQMLLAYIDRNHRGGNIYMAGSGVSHFDMQFARVQMSPLIERIHYAPFDISILRRAFKVAEIPFEAVPASSGDAKTHRALDDAMAHMKEGRHLISQLRQLGGHRVSPH